jgi:hypothetical protein
MTDAKQPVAGASTVRGRLLIISQVYVPDPAAVGQHLADVAEEMARRGWHPVVFTSERGYDDPTRSYPVREYRSGVDIRRLPFSSFGKRSISIRLVAQCLFLAQALFMGLFAPKPDVILVSTSPPFAGFTGALLSWMRRVPFVWWVMDINPDQMIATGKIPATSLAVTLFHWLNRITLRMATKVVTLDDFMARRLEAKEPIGNRLVVIPPWSHAEPPDAALPAENTFRRRHGLEGKFVVMYSGNHALQHPLDTLLDTAASFEHDPKIVFVFVGGGAGKVEVERRIEAGAKNLRSLPYQPLVQLQETLAAADVHVVSMGNNMVGIVHPCKIYGILAIGRPVLFIGPLESHVGQIVGSHRLGWQVDHGNFQATSTALAHAMSLPAPDRHSLCQASIAFSRKQFPHLRLSCDFCDILAMARPRGR